MSEIKPVAKAPRSNFDAEMLDLGIFTSIALANTFFVQGAYWRVSGFASLAVAAAVFFIGRPIVRGYLMTRREVNWLGAAVGAVLVFGTIWAVITFFQVSKWPEVRRAQYLSKVSQLEAIAIAASDADQSSGNYKLSIKSLERDGFLRPVGAAFSVRRSGKGEVEVSEVGIDPEILEGQVKTRDGKTCTNQCTRLSYTIGQSRVTVVASF